MADCFFESTIIRVMFPTTAVTVSCLTPWWSEISRDSVQVGPDFVLVDMRAGHSRSEELLVSSR